MVREIRILGDPVLRRPGAPIGSVDDEVRGLIDDLFETMYAADGVGLAAPQVGISRRVCVIDVRDPEQPPLVLVDPDIVNLSEELEKAEEGCLSIPEMRDIVERPVRCMVTALDRDGNQLSLQAEGLLARAIQHEVDHLNGVLFIDRLSPLKRRMLLKKWRKEHASGASAPRVRP
jgi:peptide deformylase